MPPIVFRAAFLSAMVLLGSCHRSEPRESSSMSAGDRGNTGATAQAGSTAPTPTQPPVTGPNVILRPTGAPPVTVHVEVQRTEAERERGLMFRRDLDELAGMIFVFERPEHQTFWMRNTYLPLDMVFISADRRVLGVVRNATPMTDDAREVPGDSMYVLEVRAGFADRHHITDGTPIELLNIGPAIP